MKPIKTEVITIKKCEQLKHQLLVAIDCGNALTKVLFLNKINKEQLFKDNEETLMLDLGLFHSEDFEHAIIWVRDNAYIQKDDTNSLHITGSFSAEHEKQIKSILNRNALYIDEFLTIAVGCKFALNYIGVENLLAKPVEYDTFAIMDNNLVDMFADTLKSKMANNKNSSEVMESCLFYVQGSSSACFYYDENSLCEYFDSLHSGNQTVLGLSKCLLNSNVLIETIELASKGKQSNVDTVVKEKMEYNINSPYGQFSSDIPIFSFGKCEDYNIGLEDLSKEDMSVSLMGLQIQNIISFCTSVCVMRNVSKIYLCGSLFDSEVFRKLFLKLLSNPFNIIEPDILDFKDSAILGALIYEGNHDRTIMKNSIML